MVPGDVVIQLTTDKHKSFRRYILIHAGTSMDWLMSAPCEWITTRSIIKLGWVNHIHESGTGMIFIMRLKLPWKNPWLAFSEKSPILMGGRSSSSILTYLLSIACFQPWVSWTNNELASIFIQVTIDRHDEITDPKFGMWTRGTLCWQWLQAVEFVYLRSFTRMKHDPCNLAILCCLL